MPYPNPPTFIAFLDANPGEYKNTPEADGYNSTQDIADQLTLRPMIANPEPQGTIPTPLENSDLQALLSEDSIGRLSDSWWATMQINLNGDDTSGGSRSDASSQVTSAVDRNNISDAEGVDLIALINSTELDPDWPATVPGPSDAKIEWDLGGMSHSFINTSLGRV